MVHKTNTAPSRIQSPFGPIELTTRRDSSPDLDLIAFRTLGRLIRPDGDIAGVCRFASYRRKRSKAALNAAQICDELDAVSQEELDLGEALASWNPQRLEGYINNAGLLIAERVEVFAPAKGSGAWKALYFATMEKTLAQHRHRPEEFFFTVFPLDFTGRVNRGNLSEFQTALRSMKLLYATHLGAKALGLPKKSGSFMRAPVPEAMLRQAPAAWME
jgi:hypothetical protein